MIKKKEDILIVQQKEEDCWKVKNATKGTEYTVMRQRRRAVDSWECTCPDFQYRVRHCKHINAVIKEEAEQRIKHEDIAVERTEDLMILD